MKKIAKKISPKNLINTKVKSYQPISNCLLDIEANDNGDFMKRYKKHNHSTNNVLQQSKPRRLDSFMYMELSDVSRSSSFCNK